MANRKVALSQVPSPPFRALWKGENQKGWERWRDLPFLGLQRYQLSCAPAGRFLPQETAGVGHTQPGGNSARARQLRLGPRGQQQTAEGAWPQGA